MWKHLAIAVLFVLAAATGAPAEEESKGPAVLGEKVPDFTMKDEQGRPFQLYKSSHSRAEIEASVRATAAKYGAAKDASLETKIADLPGVKEDGELDEVLVQELACAAGSYYGMTATEESAAAFEKLSDLVAWIEKGCKGPTVFVCWSPNCPSVKTQNDRLVEFAANAKVRVFAIASNYRDTDEHYDRFRDAFDFHIRIFPDRDQRVTDILGGKKTPHFFLVSPDHVLEYHGALDNDAMGYMDDEERQNYLLDAVTAVRAGKDVPVTQSEPSG